FSVLTNTDTVEDDRKLYGLDIFSENVLELFHAFRILSFNDISSEDFLKRFNVVTFYLDRNGEMFKFDKTLNILQKDTHVKTSFNEMLSYVTDVMIDIEKLSNHNLSELKTLTCSSFNDYE